MLFVDVKYVGQLSTRLRNFKQKSDYLWNYSCNVCGDSTSTKTKARGYIYRSGGDLFVKCHKCGYSGTFAKLLKRVDSSLYSQYALEKYTLDKPLEQPIYVPQTTKPVEQSSVNQKLDSLKRLCDLPESHPAVRYAIDRKIPKDKWNLLYFAPKFKSFTNSLSPKFVEPIKGEHPRMIIPFFDENGTFFAFQARAYGNEIPKYFTIKLDESKEKVYGMERIDQSKTIYVVEGPIDSLFLPNCIAVAGSGFDTQTIKSIRDKCVLVMDNEPRSKDITKLLEKNIAAGYTVCMLPEHVSEKDINEIILGGTSVQEIMQTINTNTVSGIEAVLKFSKWRKT